MLLNLYIKDFGIIVKTEINFALGLNILSGETGSGKSIVIEAIQVITGGRASSEYIRAGCEKAIIQAAVEIKNMLHMLHLNKLLTEKGIMADLDEPLILMREISISGRNLCRLNGQLVTLNIYREICQQLVDIQRQHEQQILYSPDRQLFLLDTYGGESITTANIAVAAIFREWRQKKVYIDDLQINNNKCAKRQEDIIFQINEIDSISPKPSEDDEILVEKYKLVNCEKITTLAGECYHLLHGEGSNSSSLDLTGESLKAIEKLVPLDSNLGHLRDLIAGAFYQIEDAGRELAAYIDSLEYYPARLEYIEERLNSLALLKKKYGQTLTDVLSYREKMNSELQEMGSSEQTLATAKKELDLLKKQLDNNACILSKRRKEAAIQMEKEIARELEDMEMGNVKFYINFTDREDITENGREKAEYLISTNPGEPLRPLSRVASGGETSRLLLAIKRTLNEAEGIPTIVFDEVDAGIGGNTIQSVAIKLYNLSKKRQVICVTHSSVVASMAQEHHTVRKREMDGRTSAEIYTLNNKERLEELTRMLGGGDDGKAAYEHARHLLEKARIIMSNKNNK